MLKWAYEKLQKRMEYLQKIDSQSTIHEGPIQGYERTFFKYPHSWLLFTGFGRVPRRKCVKTYERT